MGSRSPWLTSTFEPRRSGVPQAIGLINDDTDVMVFGPFCRHCGTPLEYHSKTSRCPRSVGPLFPPPECDCHGIEVKAA